MSDQGKQAEHSGVDSTYDETKWMAIAIELLAVASAVVFAVVQSW